MSITRCASSHLMTELLTWRNPQGSEEGWWSQGGQSIPNGWKHAGKVITTEIGLGILILTSVVERVAYTALAIVSIALYPVTDRPFRFFGALVGSSSFTIMWGLADALIYNPFFINVMTKESFARYWAEMFDPSYFRQVDRLFIADWHQQHRPVNVNDGILGPIVAAGRATQLMIDQGANFITHDVLAGASTNTTNLFRDTDPSIFMFILTKAVYIYTAGSKKNEEIPDFFQLATKNLIRALRQECNDEAILKQLQYLTENPTQFETEPQVEGVKSAFVKLKNIASGELQNSLLTTRCWQKAIELLPK